MENFLANYQKAPRYLNAIRQNQSKRWRVLCFVIAAMLGSMGILVYNLYIRNLITGEAIIATLLGFLVCQACTVFAVSFWQSVSQEIEINEFFQHRLNRYLELDADLFSVEPIRDAYFASDCERDRPETKAFNQALAVFQARVEEWYGNHMEFSASYIEKMILESRLNMLLDVRDRKILSAEEGRINWYDTPEYQELLQASKNLVVAVCKAA